MMKRTLIGLCALAAPLTVLALANGGSDPAAVGQAQPPAASQPQQTGPPPPQNTNVPPIVFESVPDVLKYSPDMNLGEVLGVAVNSKGRIAVLNHPGSAASGPIYGNASTQIFEFDSNGKFIREVGKGVYGFGYGHGIRYDKYDNLWVVDKGTHAVTKFNPAGYTTMNLGRRPEGPDDPEELWYRGGRGAPPQPVDGYFRAPTDIAWDSEDNIYISDGYVNSRIAKFDKNGNWVSSWGSRGSGGVHGNENPSQLNTPHNIGVDRQNHVYVADRNNRRIQVFDRDGKFERFILLNVPYDKKRHPVLGGIAPNPPDETQPWTICITNGATQYLYTSDSEPGRIYKMTLDGTIVGVMGESGRGPNQFNWIHSLACPTDDVLYVADMNNWRVQKLVMRSSPRTSARLR